MKNREKILTHSIPVYTLFLRMVNVVGDQFTFTKNNKWYNNIARNVCFVNDESMEVYRRVKTKNDILYDIQMSMEEVYKVILNDMRGKKGAIRSVMAGRYNFTARDVIKPDETLRIDEIRLPYVALVILLEQTIINFLVKSLSLTYTEAYKRWFKSQIVKDPFILNIIKNIINSKERGIAFIINRNPSINHGSLLQMYCVDVNEDDFTMSVPLQILKMLGADFDGDCMNIMYIINKEFERRASKVLNPRNAMMISRNDGKFNSAVNHFKDTYVNLNSLIYVGRDAYSEAELDNIRKLQSLK
jgi:RNA polymerase rpb1, domain 2